MKFLIFGDVVGRPGREAINRALPELRKRFKPDSVIVNIENMAHGAGISPSTLAETNTWQADIFTTGDHAWDNTAGSNLLEDKTYPIIRPANYPIGTPGVGYRIYSNGAWQIAVINLQGQVFFKNHPDNPFHVIDSMLKQDDIAAANIKLIDFHSEASSEARAFGWHVDGRVSAVWGTHTHVPTADAQILPQGTAYITDIGMNGNYDSIIGGTKNLLKGFLNQRRAKFDVDDPGQLEIGAIYLEVDPSNGQAIKIDHIRQILPAL